MHCETLSSLSFSFNCHKALKILGESIMKVKCDSLNFLYDSCSIYFFRSDVWQLAAERRAQLRMLFHLSPNASGMYIL